MVTRPRGDAFAAIADPTRRRILELLWSCDEVTAGALAERFPHVTRPAISKHLGVLRAAGLVRVRPEGRRRLYGLDARALLAVDGWLERYRVSWERRLFAAA